MGTVVICTCIAFIVLAVLLTVTGIVPVVP
jgi:hypothetical protein